MPINAFNRLYMGSAAILTYHMVVDRDTYAEALNPIRRSMVTLERFEEQIRFLSRRFTVISMDELGEAVKAGGAERYAVVTFDDGYRSTMNNALPVLRKHKVPAALYLTTSFIDEKRLWWLEAHDLIRKGTGISARGRDFPCSTGNTEKMEETLKDIIMFGSASRENQEAVISALKDAGARPSAEAMTWDDARLLSGERLVSIGAHTHRHLILSGLSESEARADVSHSKRRLEEELGKPIRHFAYPFGGAAHAGKREFRIAAEGFETAVTMRRAGVHAEHLFQMHALPRYPVMQRDTPLLLGARLSGLEAFIKHRGRRVVI